MISRRDFTAAEQSIDGRTLAGYAAVYGQDSREIVEGGRKFTERIAPGAFNETLSSGADVKLFYNHDASMPLARTRSKTLTLKSDRNGLAFSAELPDTTLGRDIKTLLERGDLTGEMSFRIQRHRGQLEQGPQPAACESRAACRGVHCPGRRLPTDQFEPAERFRGIHGGRLPAARTSFPKDDRPCPMS